MDMTLVLLSSVSAVECQEMDFLIYWFVSDFCGEIKERETWKSETIIKLDNKIMLWIAREPLRSNIT
jgi:hypothetical protein